MGCLFGVKFILSCACKNAFCSTARTYNFHVTFVTWYSIFSDPRNFVTRRCLKTLATQVQEGWRVDATRPGVTLNTAQRCVSFQSPARKTSL